MKQLVIKIDLKNSAFDDYPEEEIKRILTKYTNNIISLNDCDSVLKDINGNTVGESYITGVE